MNTNSNAYGLQDRSRVPHDSIGFGAAVERARNGCQQSLGHILDMCRNYLLASANAEHPRDLAGKIAPSDVVQESLLEAQRDFAQFRGNRQRELIAWLNQILRNNILNAIRHYRSTGKRQVSRESDAATTGDGMASVADTSPGPRSWAIVREEAALLGEALEKLRPDYRQAIVLRSWHRLAFAEVGQLMDRSPEAARKLWSRGMSQLESDLKLLGAL